MTKKYDVIIVGAGIGGLVCGCYLAKAGKKVLILEKNEYAGGCCSSFQRGNFNFDSCVHSVGGLREGGVLSKIFSEINVLSRFKFLRYSPSDLIKTPHQTVSIYKEIERTKDSFKKAFPEEQQHIDKFFEFLFLEDINKIVGEYRGVFFSEFFDGYFKDEKIKSIFSSLLLGTAGLPSSMIDCSRAMILLREFIFDGGYFLSEGAKEIPKVLVERFYEYGGKILYNLHITDIIKRKDILICHDKNGKNGECFSSDLIVANCNILTLNTPFERLRSKFEKKEGSLSAFTIFLTQKNNSSEKKDSGKVNLWNLPIYDTKKMYNRIKEGLIDGEDIYFIVFFSKKIAYIFVNAPDMSENFWIKQKQVLADRISKRAKEIFSELDAFDIDSISTPKTLLNYTGNWRGSAYGLEAFPDKTDFIRQSLKLSSLSGFFTVGHWSGMAHGVAGVSYNAQFLSNFLINSNVSNKYV